jgi:hypothetical protein
LELSLQYQDYTIELFDDTTYTGDPGISAVHYDLIYTSKEDAEYILPTKHGIKVYSGTQLLKSAILSEAGGATGITTGAALLDDGNLVIRCSNKVYSLTLPELKINWVTETDRATCFSIHKYKGTYITHGELQVARIDKTGKILWSYRGADIFVCMYDGTPFEMFEDYIILTGFNGSKYTIDYDGNTLGYEEAGTK